MDDLLKEWQTKSKRRKPQDEEEAALVASIVDEPSPIRNRSVLALTSPNKGNGNGETRSTTPIKSEQPMPREEPSVDMPPPTLRPSTPVELQQQRHSFHQPDVSNDFELARLLQEEELSRNRSYHPIRNRSVPTAPNPRTTGSSSSSSEGRSHGDQPVRNVTSSNGKSSFRNESIAVSTISDVEIISSESSKTETEEQSREGPLIGFRLAMVRGLSQKYTVSLPDLLAGDVERCVLLNYMFDMPWMYRVCPTLRTIPLVEVAHGEKGNRERELRTDCTPNTKVYTPKLPLQWGCHHTKMIIAFLRGSSSSSSSSSNRSSSGSSSNSSSSRNSDSNSSSRVRIVICTNNFIECDWQLKNQGIWVQEFPLKSTSTSTSTPSSCQFEDDLVDYFSHYTSCGLRLGEALRRYDYSAAQVVLVPSVPGYHKAQAAVRYGHPKVREVLAQEEISSAKFGRSPLLAQFSSIGSLDKAWLEDEFAQSLLVTSATAASVKAQRDQFFTGPSKKRKDKDTPAGSSTGSIAKPIIRLAWPNVENVRGSLEGYAAGGSIPFPQNNLKDFLRPYFYKYDCAHNDRRRCMPHMKSYTRISSDGSSSSSSGSSGGSSSSSSRSLAWVILTSANCSKAAWGALQKNASQLMIRHYEMGVLFLPSRFTSTNNNRNGERDVNVNRTVEFRVVPEMDPYLRSTSSSPSTSTPADGVVYFPFPHRLDPAPYSSADQPWVWDREYSLPDSHGHTWRT